MGLEEDQCPENLRFWQIKERTEIVLEVTVDLLQGVEEVSDPGNFVHVLSWFFSNYAWVRPGPNRDTFGGGSRNSFNDRGSFGGGSQGGSFGGRGSGNNFDRNGWGGSGGAPFSQPPPSFNGPSGNASSGPIGLGGATGPGGTTSTQVTIPTDVNMFIKVFSVIFTP